MKIRRMTILGIIPARGGSKGIPRKNMALLKGKPLLAYTVKSAKGSRLLSHFIVSSDDPAIMKTARKGGADVPFRRPSRLATDTASSVDVARHAVEFMEKKEGVRFDFVCLLQPTAPLRSSLDIDNALRLLLRSKADSVVSVVRLGEPHPAKLFRLLNGRLKPFMPHKWKETLRRQECEPLVALNGAVYGVKRDVLMKKRSLWGGKTVAYVMPMERSVNIDDPKDLALADTLLSGF